MLALGQNGGDGPHEDIPPQYLPIGADYIRLYSQIKGWLYEKNGPYRDADGLIASGPVTGQSVPRITRREAGELMDFWNDVFQRIGGELAKTWRPIESISKAHWDAFRRYQLWLVQNPGGLDEFVSLRGADQYFQILGRYVQELDAGRFFGFTTAADYERAWNSIVRSWQMTMPRWVPGAAIEPGILPDISPPPSPPTAHGEPFLPPVPEAERPRAKRWPWIVGGLTLAGVGVAGALIYRRR